MARKILLKASDGSTTILHEVAAHDELELQKRLTENPDLIPIEEFGWTGPLMVIGRETRLASGSIDLVGVSQSGEVLLAEFKTGPQNPDFRSALAQALDYGSDLWGMTFEQFDETVAVQYFNSDHCPSDSPTKGSKGLMEAAQITWGTGFGEEQRAEFQQKVATALQDGTIHYVVVAQRFTAPMQRTADYLNATTKNAAFYLVELIRFSNNSSHAFEARTVLRPNRTKPPQIQSGIALNQETFLAQEPSEDRRHRLKDLLSFVTGLGYSIFWGTTGISLKLKTPVGPPLSVGWIFPTGVIGWRGLAGTSLGYDPASAAQHPELAPALATYYDKLLALPGAKATIMKAIAFSGDAESVNDTQIRELLSDLASEAGAEE